MLVIDGRNRAPEGPIEESYLQRSPRDCKVWIDSHGDRELGSGIPIVVAIFPLLVVVSELPSQGKKNLVGFLALPH